MKIINCTKLSIKDIGKYYIRLDKLLNELYHLSLIEIMNQNSQIPNDHFFQVLTGKRIDVAILDLFDAKVKSEKTIAVASVVKSSNQKGNQNE